MHKFHHCVNLFAFNSVFGGGLGYNEFLNLELRIIKHYSQLMILESHLKHFA